MPESPKSPTKSTYSDPNVRLTERVGGLEQDTEKISVFPAEPTGVSAVQSALDIAHSLIHAKEESNATIIFNALPNLTEPAEALRLAIYD